MNTKLDQLWRDFGTIILSVFLAVHLIQTGTLHALIAWTSRFWFLDSFLAGFFFTSAFTTAPAIAALGTIAQTSHSVLSIAFFGGIGALCGDLIIFRFFRDKIRQDILYLTENIHSKRLRAIIHLRLFRWITFFLGALIIASPLPDELGIFFLGFSKTKTKMFILISYVFNTLGILAIILLARAI